MKWLQWLIVMGIFLGVIGISANINSKKIPVLPEDKTKNSIFPFPLRYSYYTGKMYAKENDKEHLSYTVSKTCKIMETIGFFMEKENQDSISYYFEELENYLHNGRKGKWLKAAKMTQYNIRCEYYIDLFNKTNNIKNLNQAGKDLEKVLNEYKKEYSPKRIERSPEWAEETIENEKMRAYTNLAIIKFLKQKFKN